MRKATCTIADSAELAAVRQFAQTKLSEWGVPSLADSTMLVVSELATNAVLHGGSSPEVSMKLDGAVLRIEVRDASTALPQVKAYSETATTGRGMVIVQALSNRWGAEADGRGKVVWCELPAPHGANNSRVTAGARRQAGRMRPNNLLLCWA